MLRFRSLFISSAILVAMASLGACSMTSPEERAEVDDCAVSNHRIIQSSATVGVGEGNFLSRHRQAKQADEERARARRLNCGAK